MKPALPIKIEFDDAFFEGEWRSDHFVTPTIKKVWAVEIDLLDQFIKFCEHYQITYYAAFGTILGAVRHRGFIPWDDDIDVVVPRKDYEKIEKYAPKYFKEPYFFQTERTDPGFSRYFARLRNSSTTAIAAGDMYSHLKTNQGIWIDIFPMDNIPDDSAERQRWIKSLNKLHRGMRNFSRMTLRYNIESGNETLAKKLRFVAGPIIKPIWEIGHFKNPYYEKYERLSKKYLNEDTKMAGVPWFTQFKERAYWDKTLFGKGKSAAFENIHITVPEEDVAMLEHIYGDWKKPVKGAAIHRATLFDPENSYKIYVDDPDRLKEKVKEETGFE